MPEELTPQQSLRLIQEMIDKTRVKYSYQSVFFLLWGWGTFIALTAQFFLKAVLHSRYHYHVWWISIVCLILTFVLISRKNAQSTATTYVGDSMRHLWSGLGISFFVISVVFAKLGWYNCYPFFMALYGVGTFVSGKILQFRPFVIGGIICWLLSATSVWFGMDIQMLFAAAAILFSYIIPGHLLRSKYRTE